MKKGLLFLVIICLTFGLVTGCNKTKKVGGTEDKYKVEIVDDDTEASGIVMKVKRAKVTNDIRAEEAKKMTEYLDSILDKAIVEYQDSIINYDEEIYEGYSFEYEYSLLNDTDNYLIFKLETLWQAGGPFPSNSTEYYMFDKETGEIIYFNDLFTSEEVNKKVYDYIIQYLEKVYKEQGDTFKEVESGITESVLEPGKFVYNDNKLLISLPKGLYTVAAYGAIEFEVPSSVYSSYLK